MKRFKNFFQKEAKPIVKGIFLLLTVIFLCVDSLPHYLEFLHGNNIELANNGEQESESDEKEKEKNYLFNNIHLINRKLGNGTDGRSEDSSIINHYYMDVFTPPPEHYS